MAPTLHPKIQNIKLPWKHFMTLGSMVKFIVLLVVNFYSAIFFFKYGRSFAALLITWSRNFWTESQRWFITGS